MARLSQLARDEADEAGTVASAQRAVPRSPPLTRRVCVRTYQLPEATDRRPSHGFKACNLEMVLDGC